MEGNADPDGERGLEDPSTAEGDGYRSRYSMLARCASQSSLDESSQRRAGGDAGEAGEGGAGAQHATALLDALARLRCDGALCDVRLQAQAEGAEAPSEGVWAHRAVLAACSPYFRAMFTQFDERTQDAVTIQNVEPHALSAIIEYVYNPNSLVITEDNVQSLLSASSLLQVSGVRAACCSFLAAALAPDNALGIRAFAELHACRDLRDCAARYVHRHFVEVLETEEFLSLTAETLAQLLDSDRIMVPNEEVVLDAVIRWMQHNAEERQQHLGALLEHVRLPLLARDALVARAAAEPLAGAGLRVKDLVIEALSFHLLRPERRAAAAAACARARPRQPPRAPKMLLVVGGQAPKAIRCVEALQLEAGRWRRAADLPSRRCRAGLAVVAGKLYAVGGFNGTLRVRSVDIYDACSDSWAAGPPLCFCLDDVIIRDLCDISRAGGHCPRDAFSKRTVKRTRWKEDGSARDGALWEDPDFPADISSIGCRRSPPDLLWMRPHELSAKPRFLGDTTLEGSDTPATASRLAAQSTDDLTPDKQTDIETDEEFAARWCVDVGEVGDSNLCCAAAALALTPRLLARAAPPHSFRQGYTGAFRFQFWVWGSWRWITVDDRLPTRRGRLITSRSALPHDYTVPLLEKAYAK
ncbi:PREDICTED: ring canal kelch homolog [Papilio polytes]|uniref:ring canal kelch homolog n=1 Tax=Papilio polytes TaxID=76194 RepID=UPI00067686DB|nr:PREDICTED: ring canal kelch homolog [Papilio polytes]